MRKPSERKGIDCDTGTRQHVLTNLGRPVQAAMSGSVEERLHHGNDTYRAQKVEAARGIDAQ